VSHSRGEIGDPLWKSKEERSYKNGGYCTHRSATSSFYGLINVYVGLLTHRVGPRAIDQAASPSFSAVKGGLNRVEKSLRDFVPVAKPVRSKSHYVRLVMTPLGEPRSNFSETSGRGNERIKLPVTQATVRN
jgi:hypothetical protein